jgi:hypothetical protein
MNGPNISVYPDTGQVGVFDAKRQFGALFNVADAVADYGGGKLASCRLHQALGRFFPRAPL